MGEVMSATEYAELRERGEDHLLLDVREVEEFETAKIDGAELVPLRSLPENLEKLEPHRSATVVCMCHHGGRSRMAQDFLLRQGFERVINLEGGIDAWSLEVDPDLPRY